MKTNFLENLMKSNKGLKEQRANLLNKRMTAAQDNLIANLERKVDDINFSIMEMEDFGPTSSFDLKTPDLNSVEWVTKYHKILVDKRILDIELLIARETKKKWFTVND